MKKRAAVKPSAKEIAKANERELLDALAYREANRALREKLRDDPKLQTKVRQLMLDDLRRVAEHPLNNSIVSPVSRQCYRDKLGHFPEILVTDFFGNHSEFLRQAGLSDSRSTAKGAAIAAKLSSEQTIHRYATENVVRFHGKYDFVKGRREHIEGLVCSDVHSMHCDPFARSCFMRAIEIVQPDVVIVNGDLVDFPAISTHPKLPGHFHLNLQQEIDWGREFLRDVRKRAPSATIYFVIGNHEARLVRYLADTAPALASLRTLSFGELFGLEELQVSLVCRSNFLAPTTKARKQDVAENWVIVGDCYAATHGSATTKLASEREMQRFMMSGTSGHTHRPQVYYHRTLGTGGLSWMSTPMLCHESDGRDFVVNPSAWNCGFGSFSILPSKRLVSQQIVQVHDEVCFFAGSVFRPTPAVFAARKHMSEVA